MEFYGIEMKGEFLLEILDTQPTFETGDTGRLIYVNDTQTFYFGGQTEWIIPGENLAATLPEVLAEVEANKYISPLIYSQLKATSADVITGTNNIRKVTPLSLRGLKASIAESKAGVDDIKYVTPAGLSGFAADNPGVLPGTIIYYAKNTAPSGYLKANGAAVSRTTYSSLFAVIGTTFGAGNGTTTFNVPDLRGEFIRGWADGRAVDTGRTFASFQADEFKSHTHNFYEWYNDRPIDHDSDYHEIDRGMVRNLVTATSATGGSETRPRNIALLACIKY